MQITKGITCLMEILIVRVKEINIRIIIKEGAGVIGNNIGPN